MSGKPARACANAKRELDRIESELRAIAEFYFTVGSALPGDARTQFPRPKR